jgi:hypothetical protein
VRDLNWVWDVNRLSLRDEFGKICNQGLLRFEDLWDQSDLLNNRLDLFESEPIELLIFLDM